MIRKIIQINEEKCNGCGACAAACHEGAIGMVEGKAKLLRDDYCDGLGDCLPTCPTNAITFVEREAAAYDEKAVEANKQGQTAHAGCPGHQLRSFAQEQEKSSTVHKAVSRLAQWPCQIKLVPVQAPYFVNADLLIAADCTAFAYAGLHEEFMKGRITLVGCPKLDSVDYSVKLAEIFQHNQIKSVTVTRMEEPCCGGLELAVRRALESCGNDIPCKVVTLSMDGNILKITD